MSKYRFHEIDLLRGFACLAVVGFHYLYRGQTSGWIDTRVNSGVEAVARFGYLGVNLFFIISGFVIFMSAEGSTLRSFTASRVARLYPALWAAVSLTGLFIWGCGSTHFSVQFTQFLVNMTLVPQWFNVEFVDGAYWSLAVELQFYLLVAGAVALKWTGRAERLVAVWLTIAGVNAVSPMYPLEFWLAAKWAPLFSAGICFYLLRTRGRSLVRLALLAVSYVLAVFYEIGPNFRNSQGATDIVAVWVGIGATSAFYAVFLWISGDHRRFNASPLSIWAGLTTYPVYLLHQNIGYILLEKFTTYKISFGLRLLFTVSIIGIMAWIIVRYVENPLSPKIRKLLDAS